jgi:hypothetical protein
VIAKLRLPGMHVTDFIQGEQYQIAVLFKVEHEFGFSVVTVPRYDRSGV